jgi:hypothetical protein
VSRASTKKPPSRGPGTRPSEPGAAAEADTGARAWIERRATGLAALLLLLLALQGIVFITESSQTSDEAAHLAAGYSYLVEGDYRLNPEHPPLIKMLAALPLLPLQLDFPRGALWEQAEEWNIGRLFVHENRVPNDTLLLLARLPVLGLSILLGLAIYRFARRLFGAAGGLLALSIWVLDPNVVAHSGLVTTDLGIALFIFLSVVALWSWIERPSPQRLILFGLAVGGAFASKYTAVWLPAILGAVALALVAAGDPTPGRLLAGGSRGDGATASRLRRLWVLTAAGLVAAAIAAVILLLSYRVGQIGWWFTGLDRTLHHSAIGHRAYLAGQVSETGWWYYFPLAWAIKTPPGIMALVFATMIAAVAGRRLRTRDEIVLWVPVVVTLGIVMCWKVNIGLRHLLPIYPFLCVAAGRLAWRPARAGTEPPGAPAPTRRAATGRLAAAGVALALGSAAWEAIAIAPYDLAYFNRFAGGPAHGHEWLLDSNLDWGQAHRALKRYADAQNLPMIYCAFNGNSDPWYYGVRYQYAPGSGNLRTAKDRPARMPDGAPRELFAINAMILHSLHFSRPDLYAWLLGRKPLATPGYAWFVFDITRDAASHAHIAANSLQFSLPALAEFEAHRALAYDPTEPLAQAVLQALAAPPPAGDEGSPEAGAPPR